MDWEIVFGESEWQGSNLGEHITMLQQLIVDAEDEIDRLSAALKKLEGYF